MSDYTNYVQDFPSRCEQLLNAAFPLAEERGLEVTLLLMVASTALLVPYERLKPEEKFVRVIEDRARYDAAAKQLDELLKESFLGSALWPSGDAATWTSAFLPDVSGEPEDWGALRNPPPMSISQDNEFVLATIRNALAHGNLYTKTDAGRKITRLVFVSGLQTASKVICPYRFVEVSPQDFRTLLFNWLAFLKEFELPRGILEGVWDKAA